MGSFSWDDGCYLQYHNGRPLSVALTEPCDCQASTFVESDFAIQPPHVRSNSSGRRFKRESYSIYHPNVQYTNFFCSPPIPRRQVYRSSSGDMLVEKLETVTIEEQQCRPSRCGASYVRTSSPHVRQVKIRSRPSSCYDLHNRESTERQTTKCVDEQHEEHYKFNFSYNLPARRVEQVIRPPSPPRFVQQHETVTNTEGYDFRIEAKPAIRPSMRSVGTTTKDLRPLSRSETQVIERFEKDEKIRRDSMTETTTAIVTEQRPSQRTHYGAETSKSHNALNVYSDYNQQDFSSRLDHTSRLDHGSRSGHRSRLGYSGRFDHGSRLDYGGRFDHGSRLDYGHRYNYRDGDDLIVRPTARHEALVDTYDIVAPPSRSETSVIPITYESRSTSRYDY